MRGVCVCMLSHACSVIIAAFAFQEIPEHEFHRGGSMFCSVEGFERVCLHVCLHVRVHLANRVGQLWQCPYSGAG